MDWSDKQVYIEKKNVPTYSYIRKKVVEHGASICEEITPSTDIMLVPVLYQLEKNVHDMYGMDVVGYPDAIADVLDVDFNPSWVSRNTLKPHVFNTVVLPEYTKDITKMEFSDIDWNTLYDCAVEMGLPVNHKPYKGNVLVVMPNTCHYNNLDYVRFYLKMRAERNNISFITMNMYMASYREWIRKHPDGIHKRPVPDCKLQNQFMRKKWDMVKRNTPLPQLNFHSGIGKLRDYVVIDTEYRNASANMQYPVLTEIGVVKVRDGEIVDMLLLYLKNDLFSLTSMMKYRGENLSCCVDASEARDILLDFIGDDTVIGHQIYSDMLVLGLNLNYDFTKPTMDTLGLIFHELDFDLGVYNLPSIALRYGLHKNSHHALDDAITTQQLYEMILDAQKVTD